eukprot:gene38157-50036_t
MEHIAAYDSISKDYRKSKELPFRKYAEENTLMQLIGDVTGLKVLDLACGDGVYSRMLKRKGANFVLGVDISEKMVELAKEMETFSPLDINYLVGDASKLGTIGIFDIIVGSYLLNYSHNIETLNKFCESISQNLAPGGRFLGLNNNLSNDPKNYSSYAKYGFIKSSPQPLKEGD